jgi:hypothetical protein
MRGEIGIETISFGRDYPHPESTWPHTREMMRDAYAGHPEHEVRLMQGENPIRILGLDRNKLVEIAERIGPTIGEITGDGPAVPADLIAHFDVRGGYLKPAEGEERLAGIDAMLSEDLAGAGAKGAFA